MVGVNIKNNGGSPALIAAHAKAVRQESRLSLKTDLLPSNRRSVFLFPALPLFMAAVTLVFLRGRRHAVSVCHAACFTRHLHSAQVSAMFIGQTRSAFPFSAIRRSHGTLLLSSAVLQWLQRTSSLPSALPVWVPVLPFDQPALSRLSQCLRSPFPAVPQ